METIGDRTKRHRVNTHEFRNTRPQFKGAGHCPFFGNYSHDVLVLATIIELLALRRDIFPLLGGAEEATSVDSRRRRRRRDRKKNKEKKETGWAMQFHQVNHELRDTESCPCLHGDHGSPTDTFQLYPAFYFSSFLLLFAKEHRRRNILFSSVSQDPRRLSGGQRYTVEKNRPVDPAPGCRQQP